MQNLHWPDQLTGNVELNLYSAQPEPSCLTGRVSTVMRVTEKDDQLILHTSWSNLLAPFVFGLFFIVIAGGMLWTAGT